jgi:hypothetical protein
MTASPHTRVPGTTLLKIARMLFDDEVLASVVEPTISDFQREVVDAGSSHLRRTRARWRGYRAFWILVLVIPFAWTPARDVRGSSARGGMARLAVGAVVLLLAASTAPIFRTWVAGVLAAGALTAIVLHAWYLRHPSFIPTPAERLLGPPQINFSSMEIAGNIGGLIFTVGTVLIVVVGLPPAIWFLFAGTVAASLFAWALVAWHTSHPGSRPENRLELR